jgi:hypothetical protein
MEMAMAVLPTNGHQRAVPGGAGQDGPGDPGGQGGHDGGDEDVGRADLPDSPADLDVEVDADERTTAQRAKVASRPRVWYT